MVSTIFLNLENGKIYERYRLVLSLTNKTHLRRGDKCVVLSDLSIYYTWKKIKSWTETINVKYQEQHAMKNLNFLMNLILYQIFKIFELVLKKHETLTGKHQSKYMSTKLRTELHSKLKLNFWHTKLWN